MTKSCLISIIIPVYNTAQYLESCVDSITQQTYSNLEIILVNDGSTDSSPNICDNLAKNDKRISVIHQKNSGVSAARNAGVNKCHGEMLMFVDSDDHIAPQMVAQLHNLIVTNNCQIASCEYTTNAQGLETQTFIKTPTILSGRQAIREMLYQRSIAAGPVCKLYHKDLFDSIRFSPSIAYGEDLEVNYRIFHKANRIVASDSRLYYYRQRVGSAIYSKFSPKRMSSLNVAFDILNDANKYYPDLIAAAINKVFTEALFTAILIHPKGSAFNKERKLCLNAMSKYRLKVLVDSKSQSVYRLFAATSFLNNDMLVRNAIKLKNKLSNTRKKNNI